MATTTYSKHICDRCPAVVRVAGAGTPPPKGWELHEISRPRQPLELPTALTGLRRFVAGIRRRVVEAELQVGPPPDLRSVLCPKCAADIRWFLSGGHLLHIGHARQSGSGKTWTELGIDKKSDPDRWFPVYAVVGDIMATRAPVKPRSRGPSVKARARRPEDETSKPVGLSEFRVGGK